jgi:hypothetical protein
MNRLHTHLVAVWPIAAIATINFLFAFKYCARFSESALIIAAIYTVLFVVAQVLAGRIRTARIPDALFWGFAALATAAWFALLANVDVSALRVDRYQMVQLWLDNLLSGKHPYLPVTDTTNVPGPFPFLYVVALPAYLLHEIGYLNIAGFVVLAWWVKRRDGQKRLQPLLFLVFLSASVPFLYEMATRSTLLVNIIVALLYCDWLEKRDFERPHSHRSAGFWGGLVLATRSIAVVPILISMLSLWRKKRLSTTTAVAIGLVMIVVFISLLAPLFLWHPAQFIVYNPLTIQSMLLPGWLKVGLVVMTVAAGWFSRTFDETIAFTGAIFFGVVGLAFLQEIITGGWQHTFWESGFDIGYFILALPFLVFANTFETTPQQHPGLEGNGFDVRRASP